MRQLEKIYRVFIPEVNRVECFTKLEAAMRFSARLELNFGLECEISIEYINLTFGKDFDEVYNEIEKTLRWKDRL